MCRVCFRGGRADLQAALNWYSAAARQGDVAAQAQALAERIVGEQRS